MTLTSLTRRCLSGLLTLTALQGGVGVADGSAFAMAEKHLQESLAGTKTEKQPQGRWTIELVDCLRVQETNTTWRQCGYLIAGTGIEVENAVINISKLTLTKAEIKTLLDSLGFPNANESEEAKGLEIPTPTSCVVVEMEIEFGNRRRIIEITLDRKNAPLLVENFLNYVQDGFYDETVLNAVWGEEVFWGGYYDVYWRWKKRNRYRIKGEWEGDMRVERGTIAFWSGGNRIDSKFFFNLVDRVSCHPVFGRVTEGIEFLDDISRAAPGGDNGDFLRANPVIIRKATFVR